MTTTSSEIDITTIYQLLHAAGIPADLYGNSVSVLRIGAKRPHRGDTFDQRAQLAAGPAHWDDTAERWKTARIDFCVGPDNSIEGDADPDTFHSFPDPASTEAQIVGYIIARLALTCPLCGKPGTSGPCGACAEVLPAQPRDTCPTCGRDTCPDRQVCAEYQTDGLEWHWQQMRECL